jgi:hypothetical protein
MKSLSILIAVTLMVSAPARADPPKVAVFDFELVDTSLQRAPTFAAIPTSWSHAANYLLRNRLLAPDYGVAQ